MATVAHGPALAAKKFAGLALVLLGFLGAAFGYENGSGALAAGGIVAVLVGVGLLALKVVRRNSD
jgi:hypothetical protein